MVVECPGCGAKNRIPESSRSRDTYRCGRCKSRLTSIAGISPNGEEREVASQAIAYEGRGDSRRLLGIALLCMVFLGLLFLAFSMVDGEMAVKAKEGLDIRVTPDDALRQIADPVVMKDIGPEERQLAELMINTMEKTHGFGLAAPQVGVSKRIIVVKLDRGPSPEVTVVMVNPEILEREGEVSGAEWSPSVPGSRLRPIEVARSARIAVGYRTLFGEERVLREEGRNSWVIQHEVDHLDGVLVSDGAARFNVTPQVLAAIGILLAFFILETRTSLLHGTQHQDIGSSETAGRRFVPHGWSSDRTTLVGAASLFLVSAAAAEGLLAFPESPAGVLLYALILVALIGAFVMEKQPSLRLFLLALALVPVYRLAGVIADVVVTAAVGDRSLQLDDSLISFAVPGSILLAASAILVLKSRFGTSEVGVAFGKPLPQLLVGLTGIIIGPALYYVVKPEPIIADLEWGMASAAVLAILVVAAAEELAFRGILQRTWTGAFGAAGLLYVSLLFAVMHLGHISGANLSILAIPIILVAALFYSRVVRETRSLTGVILSHMIANIIFFVLAPLVWG